MSSISEKLSIFLAELLSDQKRIDRISVRAKSIDRFLEKSQKRIDGKLKYENPIDEIQDQIGARIIVLYASDVTNIESVLCNHLRFVERRKVEPVSDFEFGYFGFHLIFFLPIEELDGVFPQSSTPKFFEMQVKTLFQHAWSEAEHDLAYKAGDRVFTADEKRKLAFTAAQAWGADRIFEELTSNDD